MMRQRPKYVLQKLPDEDDALPLRTASINFSAASRRKLRFKT